MSQMSGFFTFTDERKRNLPRIQGEKIHKIGNEDGKMYANLSKKRRMISVPR